MSIRKKIIKKRETKKEQAFLQLLTDPLLNSSGLWQQLVKLVKAVVNVCLGQSGDSPLSAPTVGPSEGDRSSCDHEHLLRVSIELLACC